MNRGARPPKRKEGSGKGPRTIAGELLDVRSCAALIGISAHAVRARVQQRRLPFLRDGARVVFRRAAILGFLDLLEQQCGIDEAFENQKKYENKYGVRGDA